jgi:hypothetical protein
MLHSSAFNHKRVAASGRGPWIPGLSPSTRAMLTRRCDRGQEKIDGEGG